MSTVTFLFFAVWQRAGHLKRKNQLGRALHTHHPTLLPTRHPIQCHLRRSMLIRQKKHNAIVLWPLIYFLWCFGGLFCCLVSPMKEKVMEKLLILSMRAIRPGMECSLVSSHFSFKGAKRGRKRIFPWNISWQVKSWDSTGMASQQSTRKFMVWSSDFTLLAWALELRPFFLTPASVSSCSYINCEQPKIIGYLQVA